MNRSLLCALAVASVGMLSGCGAEPGQEPVGESRDSILYATTAVSPTLTIAPTYTLYRDPLQPRGTLLGRDDPKLHMQVPTYDAHLSALALATIKCKGFLHPDDYDGETGMLKPRFDSCPLDESQMTHIKELLGIQFVDRDAGVYFSRLRLEAQKNFNRDIKCPNWAFLQTINPPDDKTVQSTIGQIGKTNNVFYIKSDSCSSAECAVATAQACSAGSGSQWWVSGDYQKGVVVTDPVWWLDDTNFPPSSNPFLLTPGYYHAMSYYGAAPGAVYGALQRAGEPCSKYYAGYHYKVKLQPVYCTSTWICMTECR